MSYHIYIVDDDRNIVESLSLILTRTGYRVAAQYDEADIVENLSKFEADLVILDVMFPQDPFSGLNLVKIIRADRRTDQIPIVMLSAINETRIASSVSTTSWPDEWFQVDEFIEKPVSPSVLLQKIGRLLSLSAPRLVRPVHSGRLVK